MLKARLTIFAGHCGSGKTSLAVNYALLLRKSFLKVAACDLDVVNPYFRTADYSEVFARYGVKLIASRLALSNVDAPALPPETQAVFDDESYRAVIDLGGDRGALTLGAYAKKIVSGQDYQMLLVVNGYRPASANLRGLREIKDEIEEAAGVKLTGIVNNGNLGSDTTVETILNGIPLIEEFSKAASLPIAMTSVNRKLYDEMRFKVNNVFPLEFFESENRKVF